MSVTASVHTAQVKRCRVCGETKPFSEFYRAAGMRDGYRSDCKLCNNTAHADRYAKDPATAKARVKKWQQENSERLNAYRREYRRRPDRKRADRNGHLMRKFGITVEEYERMLEEQGGGCAICHAPPPDSGSLHVDHDHKTGQVRALLCVKCNNAIGAFGEKYELFQAAADYVDRDDELIAQARERALLLRA